MYIHVYNVLRLKSAAIWTCPNHYALLADNYYNVGNNYTFIQVWLVII